MQYCFYAKKNFFLADTWSLIAPLKVRRGVVRENDHKMIFIKGHLCHIKHIFAKKKTQSVDLCLCVCRLHSCLQKIGHTFLKLISEKPGMTFDLQLHCTVGNLGRDSAGTPRFLFFSEKEMKMCRGESLDASITAESKYNSIPPQPLLQALYRVLSFIPPDVTQRVKDPAEGPLMNLLTIQCGSNEGLLWCFVPRRGEIKRTLFSPSMNKTSETKNLADFQAQRKKKL